MIQLYNNNLLRENKPPARRGQEKITAGLFDSFHVAVLANMLKRELFVKRT